MTDPRDPEAIVLAWLEAGPTRLPETTRRAIAVSTRTTHQAWRHAAPWRFPTMHLPRAVIAAALVGLLTVSLGGWYAIGPGSSPGVVPGDDASPTASPVSSPTSTSSPSATPRSSAAAGLDPSTWVEYTSDRYGFEIGYPADWTSTPSSRASTMDTDPDGYREGDPIPPTDFAGPDSFVDPVGQVAVSAWGVDPGPSVSLETVDDLLTWVDAFCRAGNSTPCDGIAERAVPLCRERADCHAAVLVPFKNDVMAFVPGYSDQGMLVVAVWQPDNDPSVAGYGGGVKLLLAFLSTIHGGVYLDPSA